jgi:hypothetical protein
LASTLLDQAFNQAAQLPREEQEWLARWLLAEMCDDQHWEHAFAGSADALARLADEALDELHHGKTEPIDPDTL